MAQKLEDLTSVVQTLVDNSGVNVNKNVKNYSSVSSFEVVCSHSDLLGLGPEPCSVQVGEASRDANIPPAGLVNNRQPVSVLIDTGAKEVPS